MNLTRWERFKDARTVHNQHGNQVMEEVYAATGVTGGIIQALEDEKKDRHVGYQSVAKLAAHYNVSADYLLGFTNDPHPKGTAIDDLGITPAVADRFKDLQHPAFLDCNFSSKINQLLENDDVWNLLFLLKDYVLAAKADKICEDLLSKQNGKYDEEALANSLLKIAEKYHATDSDLYDLLQAKAHSLKLSGSLANIGMDSFDLTELLTAKINRQLTKTLLNLERGVNDGID